MSVVLLYALICAAIYYLGSRAMITHFLWSRYPARLDAFMLCPACMGTWVGVILALTLGRSFGLSFLGLPAKSWITPIAVGLCSSVWTPIAGYLQIQALMRLTESPPDNGGSVLPSMRNKP